MVRMYTVLIVDDEPWVLSWIEKIFKWEEKGFKVIRSTVDPEEAYEIILEREPDVVFTDIRMPEISGLELMKMTRERGMDTEFIVISGFAEFSYAQQALREGAFDYRLKPIQMDEAEELLDKLLAHLNRKHSKKPADVLEELMNEQGDYENLLRIKDFLGKYDYFQALLAISEDKPANNIGTYLNQDGQEVLEFKLGPKKQLYIINSNTDFMETNAGISLREDLQQECYIGVSSLKKSTSAIPRLIKEADMAASSGFIYEKPNIYNYRTGRFHLLRNVLESLYSVIDTGRCKELSSILENVYDMFISNGLGMDEVVYFWNQLVAHITGTFRNKAFTEFEFMNYHQLIDRFRNLRSMCEYMDKMLQRLISDEDDTADTTAAQDVNENFEKIIEYVNRNFASKIHLKELSSMFYLNFTYCSELFKKVTGSTFSEYITGLRMKKARELLKNKDMSIGRVCEESGYSDYYYFNSVFKKYHGMTPSQYRKCKNASELIGGRTEPGQNWSGA